MSEEDLAESLDGTYSGTPVSVAYWVDAPVAQLRVVDPNGLSSEVPAALVQQLTAAGVPEAAPSELWFHPSERVYNAGVLLTLASLVVVILGPRPRRGTRWFWFWLLGGPWSVGIADLRRGRAGAPALRARGNRAPAGGRGSVERPGRFRPGFRARVGRSAVLILLTDLSPIWFLRG